MLVASLVVVMCAVAASCSSSSPDAAPQWPGFDGDISTITSSACPRILVVGDREAEAETVSVRRRGKGDLGARPLAELRDELVAEAASRTSD